MGKGLNVVVVSGNVGSTYFGKTKEKGDEVCSFTLAIEKAKDLVTWARINVYGGNVEHCKRFLDKGQRVEVQGELMNRYSPNLDDTVMEIRCIDIKFC